MLARTVTRLAALGVWMLVAACAAFWGLKLFVRPAAVPPQTSTVPTVQALRGDLTRLLGAEPEPQDNTPVPVAAAARFRLIGVVAPRSPQAAAEGLALIAVDGKPPKAYRVGAAVEGDLVLQRVRARGADLGARGSSTAAVALDVAALPAAATGVPGGGAPGAAPPRPLPNLAQRPGAARLPTDAADAATGEPDDDTSDQIPHATPLRPGLETR
jgi:general secretion pathway protein C